MTGDWLDVGALEDIPLRGARTVPVEGGDEIAVFRTGANRVYALVNKCPHKKGPLSQGIVHGDSVACPLHNWVISLSTGEAQGADVGCTPTIPVQVLSGRVMICRESTLRQAA
ncbi:nitrite reductase small subunit NirD [Sphingomonas cavernae]|uniref:Nitrite reductase (NAD(P)H) small subunit n=1 Tax=Sphingomonas cavernae TaxID=2320861 RepID=A0A418WJN9_9SPHN|nr:nitrite reductase small subunit NirD [Sphingomonas cavernae]RJF90218.1 nitrite reductase (NAD(P)H) small subunit [Sphingomonas cavernae]